MVDNLKKITMSCRKVVSRSFYKSGSSRLETCRDDSSLLNSTVSGFTLIELLVVVLIIGILASVALPQYQKAVWKSRNTQLKAVLGTIRLAQDVYYMEHGQYAANFSDLDIDLPLSAPANGKDSICSLTTKGTDAVRRGNNFQVVLNSTDLSRYGVVAAMWTDGPYKCTGFRYANDTGFECLEANHGSFQSTISPGVFCEKLERGTLKSDSGGWRKYTLP